MGRCRRSYLSLKILRYVKNHRRGIYSIISDVIFLSQPVRSRSKPTASEGRKYSVSIANLKVRHFHTPRSSSVIISSYIECNLGEKPPQFKDFIHPTTCRIVVYPPGHGNSFTVNIRIRRNSICEFRQQCAARSRDSAGLIPHIRKCVYVINHIAAQRQFHCVKTGTEMFLIMQQASIIVIYSHSDTRYFRVIKSLCYESTLRSRST